MKNLTAKEFLETHYQISHFYDNRAKRMVCFSDDVQKAMSEFTKLHVEAALKAAYEKAEIDEFDEHAQYSPHINEKSILNAYPLNLIK